MNKNMKETNMRGKKRQIWETDPPEEGADKRKGPIRGRDQYE